MFKNLFIDVECSPKDKNGEFFWTLFDVKINMEIDYGYANSKREAWENARRSKDYYERKNL